MQLTTYFYCDAIQPVAVDAEVETVDTNKPIWRRYYSWYERNL